MTVNLEHVRCTKIFWNPKDGILGEVTLNSGKVFRVTLFEEGAASPMPLEAHAAVHHFHKMVWGPTSGVPDRGYHAEDVQERPEKTPASDFHHLYVVPGAFVRMAKAGRDEVDRLVQLLRDNSLCPECGGDPACNSCGSRLALPGTDEWICYPCDNEGGVCAYYNEDADRCIKEPA